MNINKDDLIELLETIVKALKFSQENKFKIAAYEKAINSIRKISESSLIDLIANKKLNSIEGIGEGISSEIYYYCQNGKSKYLEEFYEKYPKSILELFKLRSFGVNRIRLLYENYNIKSIDELDDFISNNKYDKKFITKITKDVFEKLPSQINFVKASRNKLIYPLALILSEKVKNILLNSNKFEIIDITGQIVRYDNIIDTIEFVVLPKEKIDGFFETTFQNVILNTEELKDITTKSYSFIFDQILVKIYIANNKETYQRLLKYTIANRDFLISITDDNLLDRYPAEMQEPCNIGKSINNIDNIISEKDIRSIIHFHTQWSDGQNTLEEMYDAIQNAGFQIAAVCDHSKSSIWANGLSLDRLQQQIQKINELKENYKIKLLVGIECDILNDGSLDFSDEILSQLDIVIVAIHTFLDHDENQYTQRMIKAIEHPRTNIIAHPTGRLLLARMPYPINIYKVIDACVANNVIIEINSTPSRMDLDWQYYDYALNKGAKFAINSDAHSIDEIFNVYYGVKSARKVGIPKEAIINTYDYDTLIKTLKK